MRKTRLLILGPLPPPIGGVETVTQAVLESKEFRDMEVHHCDTTKGRPKETQGKFDLGNVWWACIHFSRMIRSMFGFRPDIVYMPVTATWSGFWRDAMLALIGKLGGARVVGHVHGGWFDRVLASSGLTRWMVDRSLQFYDGLLMLGTPWKKMIDDFGYRGKVFVVPPTTRQEVFETAERFQRDYYANKPKGLFVGQIGEGKGVFELLEAVKRLKSSGRPVDMTIVGPPEYEGAWEAIMQRRTELGIEDCTRFTNRLMGEALYDEYRRADYFILPSHAEGLPIVFIEAGAFGLPVIGTLVGAIGDLLEHESNSLLITPGNVAEIAAAIERLQNDPPSRERLGKALLQTVMRYQPSLICQKIVRAIESTI